jgi:shikimate dehydrogenase
MKITTETKLLGIIGYPIKHSLSPVLHNALFNKLKLNFVYLSFEILPTEIKNLKTIIKTLNIVGLNVTIPFKEKVLSQVDIIDPLAKEIGAINTIVNKDGKLYGYNTDIYGFVKSLDEKKDKISGKKVFVLGCGGVSKAILTGLKQLKVQKVYVSDIDKKKVFEIKRKYKSFVEVIDSSNYPKIFKEISMFVNATPVGMKKTDIIVIPPQFLRPEIIVYDVIYNRETELVKIAKKVGCDTVTGLPMFVYQAKRSFTLWTEKNPPLDYMFKIVVNELK